MGIIFFPLLFMLTPINIGCSIKTGVREVRNLNRTQFDSVLYQTRTVSLTDEVMHCIDNIKMLSYNSNKIVTLYLEVDNLSSNNGIIDVSLMGHKYPKNILHLSNINLLQGKSINNYKTKTNRFSIELNSFIDRRQNDDYFSYKQVLLRLRILSITKEAAKNIKIKSIVIECD
jgi:hypothetical protein